MTFMNFYNPMVDTSNFQPLQSDKSHIKWQFDYTWLLMGSIPLNESKLETN